MPFLFVPDNAANGKGLQPLATDPAQATPAVPFQQGLPSFENTIAGRFDPTASGSIAQRFDPNAAGSIANRFAPDQNSIAQRFAPTNFGSIESRFPTAPQFGFQGSRAFKRRFGADYGLKRYNPTGSGDDNGT